MLKVEANARKAAYKAYTTKQEAVKATIRELKKTKKLLKKKRNKQACVQRAREKKKRDKRRAKERKVINKYKVERAYKK